MYLPSIGLNAKLQRAPSSAFWLSQCNAWDQLIDGSNSFGLHIALVAVISEGNRENRDIYTLKSADVTLAHCFTLHGLAENPVLAMQMRLLELLASRSLPRGGGSLMLQR